MWGRGDAYIWNVIGLKEDTGDDRDARIVSDPVASAFQPGQSGRRQVWVGPGRGQAPVRRVRDDEAGLREGVPEVSQCLWTPFLSIIPLEWRRAGCSLLA